ncbi:MAG: hypothetical protein UH788_06565 [Treponemataceae bacterium]|nr:hypothetical protein [Treponemataceae bacterium]
MKKNLFKITILAIVGLVFVSTSFAQPSKKEDMKDKKTSYEKFIPNELPKFNEVTGTVKVEGKDENKKIYVVTDKKEKILIEVTGGPRFNFEQKPFIEKKDFEKGKKTDSKDFDKNKKGENSKGFDKGNHKESSGRFDKDGHSEFSKDFYKDKRSDFSKEFDKDKYPNFPQGFDKERFEKFKKDFEKGNFEMPHKFSYTESLIKLKGKKVTLVGKYNSDKTIFNVIGIIEK